MMSSFDSPNDAERRHWGGISLTRISPEAKKKLEGVTIEH